MPLTLATLMCAVASSLHPMTVLAKSHCDLLTVIAAISDGRNPSAHDDAGKNTNSPTVARASDLAEKAMVLAETILNALNAVEISRE